MVLKCSCVPKCRKAVVCPMENFVLDKLHSGMNYNGIVGEFNVNE